MKYDSKQDTQSHIARVTDLLEYITMIIERRAAEHDASKLREPEKPIFDEVTPKLRGMTYGSDEYKESLAQMKPALDHHYENNSHHPEHYENGIEDMTLIDLIEMLADWKAATERHADGSLRKSLEINEKRFKIPSLIIKILKNTAQDLGWVGEKFSDEPTEGNMLRKLVIAEVKRNIDYMNDYWKGWGNKDHNIRPYPNFDEMDDETLLETLVREVGKASQPMG